MCRTSNRAGARLQDSLLRPGDDRVAHSVTHRHVGIQDIRDIRAGAEPRLLLLIAAYGLGMLFSLGTHREFFQSINHGETGVEDSLGPGLALGMLAVVTLLVALVSEVFVETRGDRRRVIRYDTSLRRIRDRRARGRRCGNDGGVLSRA